VAASARAAKNSVAAARGKGKPAGRPSARNRAARHAFYDVFKSWGSAIVIFLLVRAFLVEAYRIPSPSMVPTLLVGDWLFVNKLRFGPHIPFTSASLPGYADPKRGDVVVFESPYQADLAANGEDPIPTLVKRLVGIGGDTLHMRDGLLYVNGMPQRQGYAAAVDPAEVTDESRNYHDPLFEWQGKVGLRASRFGPAPVRPTHDSWGPFVVPRDAFFMMGDNRYNSKDSRYWGFVPRRNVRGRPLFVYYSYDTERGVPFFRAFTEVRWGRLGHRIQ
jgi:signal peptidase I